MKIFITGGTGFIGKHVVEKLREKGHTLGFLSCDLAEADKWKKEIRDFNPDACVHLAWEGLPDYSVSMSRKNLNYSLDLFAFLAEIGCKTILSVGSAWEVNGRFPDKAVEGAMLSKPADAFSAAKWMANLWGTAVVEEKNREADFGGKFIWARIFFVYGPGQRETSLIPHLISCWKKGEKPEIKNPSARNDFVYIDDVAGAIAFLLENCKESGEYEIGRGSMVATQEVVNAFAGKLGLEGWSKSVELGDNNFSRPALVSKLEALGWRPEVSLEEGIQKMIDHSSNKINPIKNMENQENYSPLRKYVSVEKNKDIKELESAGWNWVKAAARNKLSYEVDWMGVPIIQTPEDLVLIQELLWRLKPDFIIETGIAHGGGLIFYASLLEIIGKGKVLGVDVEIREHNRKIIEAHPMFKRIEMLEGSSVSDEIIQEIRQRVPKGSKVVVFLDSDHTKPHVLRELELYKEFVEPGGYIVVFDTHTSNIAKAGISDKKYIDNGPMEAVDEFLKSNDSFVVDKEFNKLFTNYNPDGYLKRIK